MPGIERGVHAQPALVDALAAVFALEVLAHLLQEVGGQRGRLAAQLQVQGLEPGPGRPPRRDVLLLRHAVQHVVAPLQGAVGVCMGGEAGRGSGAGRRSRAASASVSSLMRLAEQELAGGLHAVAAVAEVDLVAVEGEDLFLGEALLDLEGQDDLLDLPLVGLLGGEEQQPRELHGQRGEALALASGAEVGEGRAGTRQTLTPMCFQKSESSTATIALRSTGGMSPKPTITRRSMANVPSRLPSAA